MNEIILVDNLIHPMVIGMMTKDFEQIGWKKPDIRGGDDRKDYVDKVKQHSELRPFHDKNIKEYSDVLQVELNKSRLFQMVCVPKRIRYFQFNNYQDGGNYGWHSDAASMSGLRTDYTVVIGMSDPKTYLGGEHLFLEGSEVKRFRVEKGQALIYPSGIMHRVMPVTKGQRVVAITWIESKIQNPFNRSLITEMTQLTSSIKKIDKPFGEATNRASSLSQNLLRALA